MYKRYDVFGDEKVRIVTGTKGYHLILFPFSLGRQKSSVSITLISSTVNLDLNLIGQYIDRLLH